jgi:hypothetical protein
LPNNYNYAKYRYSDGFHVIIHNNTHDPGYNGGITRNGIDISNGFETSINVERIFDFKLGQPYEDCLNDVENINSFSSDLFKSIINYTNYSYRQIDCFDYCIGQEIIKNCPNEMNSSFYKSFKFSETKPQYLLYKSLSGECFLKAYYSLIKSNINEICSQFCPLECNSVSYKTTTSVSLFPSEPYGNYLLGQSQFSEKVKKLIAKNSTINDLQKKLIAFNVYYEEHKYTIVTELPKLYTIDLIGNIGGLLGLFLGISFLSFGEIIYILIEIVFIIFKKKTITVKLAMEN